MQNPLPDSGAENPYYWIQQHQTQIDKNEQRLSDLKLEYREFAKEAIAKIEKGEMQCESAVATVKESLRFWGERLGKVEKRQETARMQFAALEVSFKVFAGRVNATMATIAALVTVFEVYMNFFL